MNNYKDLVKILLSISGNIINLLFVVAVMYFFWGLANYIKSSGDASERNESRKYIVYGIIGLFVMTSVWGLVKILTSTFMFSDVGVPIISF